jgi:uncharacterized membrane protein/secreted protein with Ig-like and vWFA domain
MRVTFLFPAALWLLLLLIPIWALALATPRRRAPTGVWASLLLRTLLVGALVLALAGTRLVRDTDNLTTVFLLDRSDSIAPAERARADAFVRDALRAMRRDDRAAVVAFGADAIVARPPSAGDALGDFATLPSAIGTNIQSAVQLGLALLPGETNKRLVLLSDGGENSGDARIAAGLAAARGVPVSFVDLSPPPGAGEALIAELHAPASVRVGQSFELTVVVESSVAQAAHLRVLGDGQPLAEQDVQLTAGLSRFPIKVDARGNGFQRYQAEITPRQDVRAENNAAEALVQVDGAPKVLVIENTPGESVPFRKALAAAQVAADKIVANTLPADLKLYLPYDVVVLLNVPASALPPDVMPVLQSYVRDAGRGLIMIGGGQGYGIGGYSKTPIEETLPVYMDAPTLKERPEVALVFVLDKSSSMSGCHCRGPDRKHDGYFDDKIPFNLDLAKEGVKRAVDALDPRDTVGVVMFDENAALTFPPQRGPTTEDVMQAIGPVKPIGATNIYNGLALADQTLSQTNASIKHIILFTDGLGHGNDTIAQAQALGEKGITLSVVGEGFGAVDYLQQLAQAGRGRYIQVKNTLDVPQIFLQETVSFAAKFAVEQPFTPQYGTPSPILAGLEHGLPRLYGYNGTTPKQTATIALADADGSPVLAQWQYGLGRAVAWTSDVSGRWSRDWLKWKEFPRFAAQLIDWAGPTAANDRLRVDFQSLGAQTQIDVTVPQQLGQPAGALDMRATIAGGDGEPREVPLAAQGPGEYRATIPSPPQGTYMIQVAGTQCGQVVAQETAALIVPYSPEYRLGQSDPALLGALAALTGGGELAQPAEAFARAAQGAGSAQDLALPLLLAALILLPLDILARRLAALWRFRRWG